MIDFLIPSAMAAEAGGTGVPGIGPDILIIVAFAVVFYLIVWRPQSKRTKEHRELVGGLAKGDEIITNGGLVGKITKVDEQFIIFEAADGVELKLQKGAVMQALPKGTIKDI
jgi:preprotein translocase subunit YajC